MKSFALSFLFLGSLIAFQPNAQAGQCQTKLREASKRAAKDKECRRDARRILVALQKQIRQCKSHRKALKACRKAKKASVKTCRKAKKAAKKQCKSLKGSAKRRCQQKARKLMRSCKKLSRQTKRACRKEARSKPAYRVCRNARQLTRKASGRFFKCAGRYYVAPIGACVRELFSRIR